MRYTRAKRRNHFISFISLTSMVGLALGVLVMILVLSVMNGFDEAEHRRLAEDFRNLQCRALMIIGKTPLTEELYGEYIFDEYYKNYSVNIRNRFNNDKMHIVVKNY